MKNDFNSRPLIIILLILAFSFGHLKAAKLTAEQALSRAMNELLDSDCSVRIKYYNKNSVALAYQSENLYIFNFDTKNGFIITSIDEVMPPIIGYSDIGHIDINNLPCNFRWWLNSVEDEITNTVFFAYSDDESFPKEDIQNIPPLINTKWGQSFPYNTNALFIWKNNVSQDVWLPPWHKL